MGIIEKQGLQGTILTYVGVGIGFITAGYLLPRLFSIEQNGVLDILNAWSMIFATLATLGINNVTNRLFPWFRNPQNKHNGYFGILILVLAAGLLLSTGIFLLARPSIMSDALEKSALLPNYIDLIIPLTVFTALFLIIDIYYSVLYKSVKGILHKEVLQRIYILTGIGAYWIFGLQFPAFVYLYVAALSLPGLMILLSLIRDQVFVLHINPSILSKELKNNMLSVALFGVVVSFSNILIQKIDTLMIQHFLDTKAVGIYGRVFFYGTLVAIPLRVLSKISAVVVAQAWKENQLKLVSEVYRKSTLDQLLFGLLIFIGLWANSDNVVRIIGESYASGKNVVLYIGLSNVFLMAAGVSGVLISTSDKYRILTLFVAVFGLLIILSNLIFIPLYGIQGAAMASALSALIYSLMRFAFLWASYGMQPYTYQHLLVLLIAGISYGAGLLIPDLNRPDQATLSLCIDIAVRSFAIGTVFLVLTRLFHLSPEVEKWTRKILNKSSDNDR